MLKKKLAYNKILHLQNNDIPAFLVQLQGNNLPFTLNDDIKNLIYTDPIIWSFISTTDNSARVVFDQVNFKILAISNNFKTITGIDLNLNDQNNLNETFGRINPNHLLLIAKSVEKFPSLINASKLQFYKACLCGLSILNNEGEVSRLLINANSYGHNKQGFPQIALVTINKINFMMKSDDLWLRVTYGEQNTKVNFCSTADEKREDLLSEREKDVLKCIINGLDSKAIAEKLYLSPDTVIKHRKNMLAKSGLCDTTALIQICMSCGII